MMEILVFLVVTFGLLSVFITQYISQCREIYLLWIEEIVFKGFNIKHTIGDNYKGDNSKEDNVPTSERCSLENIHLCSRVESYSREICAYANIIEILVILIFVISIVAFIIIKITITDDNRYTYYGIGVLIFATVFAVVFLLCQARINVIMPSHTSQIDKILFDIWCKSNCHSFKQEMFKKELRPARMYEILAEKIKEYGIDAKNADNDLIALIISKKIEQKLEEIEEKPTNIFDLMKKDKKLIKILEKNRKRDQP